jgi:hypothetical protein
LLVFAHTCSLYAQQVASKQPLIQALTQTGNKGQLIALTEQDLNESNLDNLLEPINFTQDGLHRFFKHIFNRKEYTTDVLPYSFNHLLQMIDFGIKSKQNATYFKAVIKLFTVKAKFIKFVTSNEVERLVSIVPDMLNASMKKTTSTHSSESIKKIILNELKNSNPTSTDELLSHISNSLETELNKKSNSQSDECEELQKMLHTFLDNLLNKILWSPIDHAVLWGSIERLGLHLSLLEKKKIFNKDEADILEWSLVQRFCHFIELAGAQLPGSFYENARLAIAKQLPGIDNHDENELATSKRQFIQDALLEGHIKSEACHTLQLSL